MSIFFAVALGVSHWVAYEINGLRADFSMNKLKHEWVCPIVPKDISVSSVDLYQDSSEIMGATQHRIGSFAGVFNGLAGENDLPKQECGPHNANENAPHGPVGRAFSGASSPPLGAKVAIVAGLWIYAWGSILYGLGQIGDGRRRFTYILVGIAIGLVTIRIWII